MAPILRAATIPHELEHDRATTELDAGDPTHPLATEFRIDYGTLNDVRGAP